MVMHFEPLCICRLSRGYCTLGVIGVIVMAVQSVFAVDHAPAEAALSGTAFIDEARLDVLRQRIATRQEPTWSAWQELHEAAKADLQREPQTPERWFVPTFYVDREGHREAKRALKEDANAVYRLALCYRMTDEPKYAEAAVTLIDAWCELESFSKEDDSRLSFSYHFPAMIFGASLLRPYEAWLPSSRQRFERFVRERALSMNTMERHNNWGSWGLVLVTAAAAYLKDGELFAEAVERWKHFIEHQLAADGHFPHEVTRNHGTGERGIWYSHFSLMPLTLVAEIARANGVSLYDYKSPSGRSLRQAFHRVAPWAREPSTFPYFQPDEAPRQYGTHYISYFEVLNPRWPHPDASEMLAERRPLTAEHSAPHLTFTHGEKLE